jgi:uncharacterized protein
MNSEQAKEKPKHGIRYWIKRISILLLISYIAVLSFLYFIQRMMVFPGHDTQGQVAAQVRPFKDSQLIELHTKEGERVMALFGGALSADNKPLPDAATRPTLIYFYGNGMYLNACSFEFQSFRRQGVNVIIPEYVGYGMSSGKPSEVNCYATADAVYDHLLTRTDINPKKIIAAGWSLGAAVAIDLASRREVIGLAAFSGFTSISDMANNFYPRLPIPSFVIKYRFDNAKKITEIKCPIFIGHGQRDTLIPCVMSEQLARAAAGPVTTHWNSADHAFFDSGSDKFFTAFREFLSKL